MSFMLWIWNLKPHRPSRPAQQLRECVERVRPCRDHGDWSGKSVRATAQGLEIGDAEPIFGKLVTLNRHACMRLWHVLLLLLLSAGMLPGCTTTVERPTQITEHHQECVVLLHGLWRSNIAMWPIETALLEAGYTVVNLDYPSTRASITEIADQHLAPAVTLCESQVSGPVHLVCHSMGGIVIRDYLQRHTPRRPGRVVMLSPPNQGAELAIAFRDWPLFELLAGEAAASLSSDERGVLNQLGPVGLDTGIIGGDRHSPWLSVGLLAEPHDGTVTLASMRLPEMKDFSVVPEDHVSIRRSPEVHARIIRFLESGTFEPRSNPGAR